MKKIAMALCCLAIFSCKKDEKDDPNCYICTDYRWSIANYEVVHEGLDTAWGDCNVVNTFIADSFLWGDSVLGIKTIVSCEKIERY